MNTKSKVAVIGCASYDETAVLDAVRKGTDLVGGIGAFIKSGEKIVLKPNVLFGKDPSCAVTTHPSVLRAVAMLCKEAGAVLTYGDSFMIGSSKGNLSKSGLAAAMDALGVPAADFDHGTTVTHLSAVKASQFVIADAVLANDGLISISKCKTHGFARFTGAVKNQFGCIAGLNKGRFHVTHPRIEDFAAMLVDINTFIKPRLYVMDAILAMEGNGPGSGTPKKLNVILVSSDPVALDAVACRIVALDPALLATSIAGEKAGLGTYKSESIELLGDPVEKFIDPAFDIVRTPVRKPRKGGHFRLLQNHVMPRPVITPEKCVKCGKCVQVCPVDPKAVNWNNGNKKTPPAYDYNRCIRCFCCHEACPEGAIHIKTPVVGRAIAWMIQGAQDLQLGHSTPAGKGKVNDK